MRKFAAGVKQRICSFKPASPQWSHGWRLTAVLACVATSVVFIVNLAILIQSAESGAEFDGVKVLYHGSCKTADHLDTLIHLFINIFATILVGGSNFCMQQLCAPTRAEVDRAHRSHQWLDIGTQSLRNLRNISRKRAALWIILALSSCPLHLFYNSAIYEQRASYDYDGHAFIMEKEYFEDAAPIDPIFFDYPVTYNATSKALDLKRNRSSMKRRDRKACDQIFGKIDQNADVTRRTNTTDLIFTVNKIMNDSSNVVFQAGRACSCTWMDSLNFSIPSPSNCALNAECGNPRLNCSFNSFSSGKEFLSSVQLTVLDCLELKLPERCRLRISQTILIVVVVANAIKIICILLTLFDDAPALVTTGDFIQSMLTKPDVVVPSAIISGQTNPFSSRRILQHMSHNVKDLSGPRLQPLAFRWSDHKYWHLELVSLRQWLLCMSCVTLCCVASGIGIATMLNRPGGSWRLPSFNDPSTSSQVANANLVPDVANGILANALCANLPQLLLTQVYLTYNNLYTRKSVAREFNSFASMASPLRVTAPEGAQKSSHYLGLPYRIAIPLQIASAMLHWLLSQTLFVSSFAVFGATGEPIIVDRDGTSRFDPNKSPPPPTEITKTGANEFVRIGFSCSALLGFLVLALICLCVGLGDDLRLMKPGAPKVKSCSAALAACCGKIALGKGAVCDKLKWGILGSNRGAAVCGFTGDMGSVREPVEGDLMGERVLCWNSREWRIGELSDQMRMKTRNTRITGLALREND